MATTVKTTTYESARVEFLAACAECRAQAAGRLLFRTDRVLAARAAYAAALSALHAADLAAAGPDAGEW